MAAGRNIKGITIEIGGDTTGMQKALSGVNDNRSEISFLRSGSQSVHSLRIQYRRHGRTWFHGSRASRNGGQEFGSRWLISSQESGSP